jgi:hypothetical protein
MQGKQIKATLSTITQESMTNGSMSELWAELPDFISGADWVGEIHDMARQCSDWISDEQDYMENVANDLPNELANNEIEDYYANINKRVQALSLWAYDELDDEVEEMTGGGDGAYSTLTALNSLYLFCAMRELAYQILTYAYEKALELEVSA